MQYNAYIEELNEGKIVLFSGNPAEREDYIGGNPRKSDPNLLVDLSHNPEARFGEETEVYDPKTNQTVKTNLQIVESTFLIPKELEPCRAEIEYELYKAINSIDGVKMPPFGPFDDRKNIRNDFRSRCYSV